jgi:predicted RNA-binding protein with PUA-like domain
MRQMAKGDQLIFYHSNAKPPGAAGIAKVLKTAEPDPTQFDPDSKYFDPASKRSDPRWDWVTVGPVRKLEFVSIDEMRGMPELEQCQLLAKGNRLSVLPLTDAEFEAIVAYSTKKKRRRQR